MTEPCLSMKKNAGFSLMELMIVVAILALVLTLAMPTYTDSVRKSRRSDATSTLMELSARQERFYAQNTSYTAEVSASSGLDFGSTTSTQGHYTLVSAAGACGSIATCYVLTATATGGQAKDAACTTISLSSLGEKTATGTNASQCW